ncbi:exopolysaccharide biosynthesis protein [Cohaesibacter gelatinilyticus]|uniref:Transmembrane protein (PGPGW) n=1 Tax=Cohaesibacter gelatinilyticus TaxID=372072 RepID=A0A285N9Q7_9HYPH|nr:exopolysaccharide biosynthesis protein [Cohaesibacter gelatinilyticus]SNZ06234.1 hypothetical protein SAMN06265368_0351 [Cohaesibacter gelatinilyticus]
MDRLAVIATFKQWFMLGLAIVCLIAGIATIWLPIPTGVPLLALGIFLLVAYSSSGRNWIRRTRKTWPFLDNKMAWIEDRAGKSIGRVLKTTRPFLRRKK